PGTEHPHGTSAAKGDAEAPAPEGQKAGETSPQEIEECLQTPTETAATATQATAAAAKARRPLSGRLERLAGAKALKPVESGTGQSGPTAPAFSLTGLRL